MEIMDIVACTDKWFVMPTGVMMYSVCVNNPDVDINFHVIVDDNVTSEDQHDLEDVVKSFNNKSACFYSFNDVYDDAFPSGRDLYYITKTTYFRLFIDVLLPSNIEKVLYLDGDIIVRHSLLPLWEVDLGNHAIAAVIDGMEGNAEFYDRLKYPPYLGYFNAGMLLINLKYWRNNHVIKEFRQYMENHSDSIMYHDQDVLNVTFREKKLQLPIKYNMQHVFLTKAPLYDYLKYEQEVLDARQDPIIIHFTGPYKPWDKYQRCPHPFRSTFYKYQNQTKWKGVKYEHRPLKMRLVNFIADTLRMLKLKSPWEYAYIDIAPVD